jgi:hypothetical protein
MNEYEIYRKVDQWRAALRGALYIAVAVGLAVVLWN